jgi:DNA-binding NarL/FixJ family response regulator
MGTETKNNVRVFLVDDHPAVRQGLALLLAQDAHTVCGEAETSAEFLSRIGDAQADIALVDLSLGEESGLDLLEELRRRKIPALIYSMHEDCSTIEKAFAHGADGYVTKREVSSVLFTAISEALSGRRYVSPRAAQSLASRILAPEDAGEGLSQREEQILDMLGKGETSADIAAALRISVRTVETYYARIIEKTGFSGMKELRKHAIQRHK